MLVLKRRTGERVIVGDSLIVTVTEVGRGYVRLGFEVPKSVQISREEIMTQQEVEAIERRARDGR